MGVLKTDKDGNEYVLLVDKEKGVLMQRNVKLGIISDMTAEVLEGLRKEILLSMIHSRSTRMDLKSG